MGGNGSRRWSARSVPCTSFRKSSSSAGDDDDDGATAELDVDSAVAGLELSSIFDTFVVWLLRDSRRGVDVVVVCFWLSTETTCAAGFGIMDTTNVLVRNGTFKCPVLF